MTSEYELILPCKFVISVSTSLKIVPNYFFDLRVMKKQPTISHFFKSSAKSLVDKRQDVNETSSHDHDKKTATKGKKNNGKVKEQIESKRSTKESEKSMDDNDIEITNVEDSMDVRDTKDQTKSQKKDQTNSNSKVKDSISSKDSNPPADSLKDSITSKDSNPPADSLKDSNLKASFKSKDSLKVSSDSVSSSPSKAPAVSKRKAAELTKPAKKKALTPLERQIMQLKEQHIDKLLLWQIGYKYKAFGEDARKCASLLNIMFIDGGDGGRRSSEFSYCSFPDFKLHINLMRILECGHKVGIVKQAESSIVKSIEKEDKRGDKPKSKNPDADSPSGVMKREVTAVYTKGTYMGDELEVLVTDNDGSYIVCVYGNSLVAVQPSTGAIVYDTFEEGELETRLMYLYPSEAIVVGNGTAKKVVRQVNSKALVLERALPENTLLIGEFFDQEGVDGSHIEILEYAVQVCISVLLEYLAEFKLCGIFTIPSNLRLFSNKIQMVLPRNSLHALEIFRNLTDGSAKGSLVWLLDHTRTRFGQRLLYKWISQPLVKRKRIEERHEAVETITSDFNQIIDAFKGALDKIGTKLDLEQMLIKIHYSVGGMPKISRREVYLLLECFNSVVKLARDFDRAIIAFVEKDRWRKKQENETNNGKKDGDDKDGREQQVEKDPLEDLSLLSQIFFNIKQLASVDIAANFMQMVDFSFIIDDKKDPEDQKTQFFDLKQRNWEKVAEQKDMIASIEQALDDELQNIRSILNRPTMSYITNNKEPYLVEVRNGKAVNELPSDWHRINGTQTVLRFRSAESARLYKRLQYHRQLLLVVCEEAFQQFLEEIDANYQYFCKIVENLAQIDCLLSLLAASCVSETSRPRIVDEQVIEVVEGRNPIIEMLSSSSHYVPNDIHMTNTNRAQIITGPNMGGKSLYVKQVALLVIMNQIGCFIPCKSATMGIFDSIFVRMGASDDILRGSSTFMTEMREFSEIVNGATPRSLIILDEIGRGTGTTDGIALAYSILDYLVGSSCNPLVLFITHYPSLHILQQKYPDAVTNYHMGFEQVHKPGQEFPEVIFLYNLVKGVVNNLYGLNVAKLASIPNRVITAAFAKSEELKERIERVADFHRARRVVKLLLEGGDMMEVSKVLGE